MTKVYPAALTALRNRATAAESFKPSGSGGEVEVLTVWKKSLLLNCKGFTVYDASGNLVFRVDNYIAASKAEVVLMDASGKPLITIRRKRLSLGESWQVYDGETKENPIFSVRRPVNFLNTKTLAQVITLTNASSSGGGAGTPPSSPNTKNIVYEIEGSYAQRNVAVYDTERRCVAEIRRKQASVGGVVLGIDVFCLIVRPSIGTPLAMALVVLLDQMFGSTRLLPV